MHTLFFRSLLRALILFLVLPGLANGQTSKARQVLVAPKREPALGPAGDYEPKNNTVVLKISEYPGYAGLLLANGGVEPSEDSFFFKNHGFKVQIIVDEDDEMNRVHSGEVASLGATPDMLAVFDRQRDDLNVVCPFIFDFSRGADQILLRSEYKNLRDLIGKTMVVSQYSCSDFFLRYLCVNNNIDWKIRNSPDDPAESNRVNILFTAQVDEATELFSDDLGAGKEFFAGCGGWTPMTTKTVQQSKGKAYVFTSTKNHLVIADVLLMNKGFVRKYPKMMEGIIEGILDGNQRIAKAMISSETAPFAIVAKGLTTDKESPWSAEDVMTDLRSIYLANYAVNEGFLNDTLPKGGSFERIYRDASKCYGYALGDGDIGHLIDTRPLLAVGKANEALTKLPIDIDELGGEGEARLSVQKDINFTFERNVFTELEDRLGENKLHLEGIAQFLRGSPGATLKLIGHLDDTQAKANGKAWREENAERAKAASMERAAAARNALVQRYGIPAEAIEVTGEGWDRPLGSDPEANRRVEIKIFTLE